MSAGDGERAGFGHARRIARTGAAVIVVLAALSAIVLTSAGGVGPVLRSTPAWAVAGALGLAVVSAFSEGAVLAILHGTVRPRSIGRMTRAYLAGGFVGSVTPYALGGGPTWIWALAREGIDVGEAAAIVTGRSIVTAAFFVLLAGVTILTVSSVRGLTGALAGAMLVPVAAIVVLVLAAKWPDRVGHAVARLLHWAAAKTHAERLGRAAERVPREIERFGDVLSNLLRNRPLRLAGALLAVAASRSSQLLAIPLLLAAQGHRMSLAEASAGLLVVWVVSSVAPSPSGEGVAQMAIVGVFAPLVTGGAAAATALVWRACVHYPLFLAGGVLFARLVRGVPAEEQSAAALASDWTSG